MLMECRRNSVDRESVPYFTLTLKSVAHSHVASFVLFTQSVGITVNTTRCANEFTFQMFDMYIEHSKLHNLSPINDGRDFGRQLSA
jgi:hypothetical protein